MGRRTGTPRRAARAAAVLPPPSPGAAAAGPAGAPASRRWAALDLLRAAAVLAMIVYHFCFDLAWLGWLAADFNEDPRWIAFRSAILGTFLLIAGVSLGLAEARGQPAARFWRRVGIIAGAAALVSLGSYAMFPRSFIYFGVLHAIAVATVLARPALKLGPWIVIAGCAVLAIGLTVQHPVFDQPLLHWVGLMTYKPRTEDYVPLFPWLGVVLIGAGAGDWAARHPDRTARLAAWRVPGRLRRVDWMGRHSLAVYLLHQPLLLGALLLVRELR